MTLRARFGFPERKRNPMHVSPPAPQTRPVSMITLPGRADPLELIVHALNASNASGFGRMLHYREFDGESRRSVRY